MKRSLSYYVSLICTSCPRSLTSWCICVSTSWTTSSTSGRHSFTAMPVKRVNGVIKGFVRNMSRPERSIVQGYLTHECMSFCENYITIGDPVVGLPVKKHDGKLEGDCHNNGRRELHVDYSDRRNDFDRANLVVLHHLDVVDDYVTLHGETIAKKNRRFYLGPCP